MKKSSGSLRLILLIFLLGIHPCVAGAHNLGLVVGVSQYPSLSETSWLPGAEHDAVVMELLLHDSGFSRDDVIVLRERKEEPEGRVDGAPTRVAILAALTQIAAKARPRDFVFLHLGGHGSQQPANASHKKQGLDATFLPRDIGRWDSEHGLVTNAITDDELLDAIARIRNTGAFVWAVFDSCHSGDIVRGAPADDRDRAISMADLGIPRATIALARTAEKFGTSAGYHGIGGPSLKSPRVPLAPGAGGVVVFSAAQSDETTPEKLLPLSGRERTRHGLFTFVLVQVLRSYPGLTYRQIVQQILARYGAMGRQSPTPVLQGDADARAFGVEGAASAPQWRIANVDGHLQVEAGLLSDLGVGSRLSVMAQPVDPDSAALGYVDVSESRSVSSVVVPVKADARPAISAAAVPLGAYARLVSRSYAFTLQVAAPCDALKGAAGLLRAASVPCKSNDLVVRAALQQLRSLKTPLLKWLEAGDPAAHVRLAVADHRVWFSSASGELRIHETPVVPIGSDATLLAGKLADLLHQAAVARNLTMLAADYSGDQSTATLSLLARRAKRTGEFASVPWTPRPQLEAGMEIELRIDNTANTSQDITLLLVDSHWGITPLYPQSRGRNNRIEPGGQDIVGGGSDNSTLTVDKEAGISRLIMITVPATPMKLLSDYSFLGQPGVRAGPQTSRGVPLDIMILSAGLSGGITRGTPAGDLFIREYALATLSEPASQR